MSSLNECLIKQFQELKNNHNMTTKITLKINGAEHTMEVEPRTLLVHAIRENASLTGTHIGCDVVLVQFLLMANLPSLVPS